MEAYLDTTFEHNNFPEPIDQHCIALRIKTPYRSIKMWFQNRRASIRKRMSPKEKGVNSAEKTKNASDPDARWYCTLCPSTFISKRFLENHKEAHERETLYCPHCNMGFTHKVLLDTHKISKCSSKTGVDLTHLEDEFSNTAATKKGKIQRVEKSKSSTLAAVNIQSALPLLMLQQLQKQQQEAKQDQSEEQLPIKKEKDATHVPPLVVAGAGPQKETSNQEDTSQEHQSQLTVIQQRRLMQQLLLVQLQQAQKAQQKEEMKQDDSQQPASPNGSLTVGGLTIFPVKSSPSDEQKIKVEVKEEQENAPQSDPEDKQPSSLQDQITSILQSQGLKSLWKPPGIKTEVDMLDAKAEKRESMQEQINAILKNQEEIRKRIGKSNEEDSTDVSGMKRHRRRTTVFNEVQLRTLYMHFTYCNFPDPSMFKIIGHLTKLEPQVIKIWFQNERSRQRKRATHIVDEVNSKEKPYKCRDCGMSFAMLTFLVKHSMRHNGDTDQDEFVRTCPLCLQKWNKDVFASHLKSRHNVNLSLVEEKNVGNLMCYLCDEKFTDQESLMIHKHKHLKDDYGDPPECKECKTTFVNAICLEAHMETHRHKEWNYKCSLCGALFHDKILLDSHRMGHGVPLAPVSTIDRSRSQLQHTSVRAIHARARKTVASAITSLNTSLPENKIATETKPNCSSPPSTVSSTTKSSTASSISSVSTILSPTLVTPSLINNQANSTISNIPFSSTQGPVSYVKLIPVQLIPVSSISGSQSNQKPGCLSTVTSAGITTPTTTFISVPVSLKGSTDANPILSQLLEPPSVQSKVESTTGLNKSNDKDSNCKNIKSKTLPNLIPIISPLPKEVKTENEDVNEKDKGNSTSDYDEEDKSNIDKEEEEEEATTATAESSGNKKKAKKQIVNGVSTESKISILEQEDSRVSRDSTTVINTSYVKGIKIEIPEQYNSGELTTHQVASTKRYVPILPMIPVEMGSKNQAPVGNTDTSMLQRTRRARNIPNKRLWQSFDPVGYKRRRTPTYFTGSQREILEAHFEHDNFPEPGEQMAIANHLGVDYAVVKTWFQNTRKNFRKQLKEENNYEDDGPFHCQKCNVSFIARTTLNEHYEMHDVQTDYKCKECSVHFAHPAVYNTHMMKHLIKTSDSKKKKYGVIPTQVASSQTETSTYEGDNEECSDTDSLEDNEVDPVGGDEEDQESERPDDYTEDGEDYHPIMAVECILDNSSGEDDTQSPNESPGKCVGHTCMSCGESFASLIALKEHDSLHCCHKKVVLKPGQWRRRRRIKGKRKYKVGNDIRCFECQFVFPDRVSYLEHFNSSNCNVGRQRIEYTDEEQKVLITHYEGNNFPMPSEMSLLARRLGVRYRQIMHWFQNRRSKERKQQRFENKYPPVECQNCKASFVTYANLEKHQELVHGQVTNPLSEFSCSSPGCNALFPNADLLLTHQLAHQIDSDAAHVDKETGGHKLPTVGQSPLWKNFTLLEAHYSENNFPDPMDIGFIARRLEVDPLHIHMWFKERRNQHIRKLEESGRKVMGGEVAVSTQRAMSKVCGTCDAAFICQTDLDTHEEMHKSSWAQVCSMCGMEYSNVVALETHWIRHGIEVSREGEQTPESKPEKTSKASFTNTQLRILDTHYEHNNFPGATEVWLVAKRLRLRPKQVTHWFQNKRGRDRRVQGINAPYSRTCPLCGAAFICELFLNNHKKIHKINSRYPCTECGAIFLSPVLQETHLLYHNVIPKAMIPFRRTQSGTKDPLTEGQTKNVDNCELEDSDSSEPELIIADSENFDLSFDNSQDKENSAKVDDQIQTESPEETESIEKIQVETSDLENRKPNPRMIGEEVFFDDNTDSEDDDDDDEPRLKIVSAYTISADIEDHELETE
ncbi:uncharacterized protein LOC134765995 [Penaeus indicus]|uniref:uncharacterized protein LOC134765995 n=1 Tax=Penaeus indicus TaxID=29960 RepID=UPI00300D6EA8